MINGWVTHVGAKKRPHTYFGMGVMAVSISVTSASAVTYTEGKPFARQIITVPLARQLVNVPVARRVTDIPLVRQVGE